MVRSILNKLNAKITVLQGAYSLRRHGTALWKLNRSTGSLEHIFDLPGLFNPLIKQIQPF